MKANRMIVSMITGLIAATFFVFAADAAPLLTEWYQNSANGHSYALLDWMTWHEAEAAAVSLGGHLVAINDAAENQWIMEIFGSFDPRETDNYPYPGNPSPNYEYFLIGATDEAVEGTWTWTTGEAFDYQNWYGNGPTDFDYGLIYNYSHNYPSAAGYWAAFPHEGGSIIGIVEVAPVPEPASMALLGIGLAGLAVTRARKKRNS